MATSWNLMSFAEFEKLPDQSGGCRFELVHGEVKMRRPLPIQEWSISNRLADLLNQNLAGLGIAGTAFGFRALPDAEFRFARVVFISEERWRTAPRDYFSGSPDLAVEILLPSDTASDMDECERLCLATGSLEFWRIDPRYRTILVTTRDGRVTTYTSADSIPLSAFGSPATIAVADVLID